MNYTYYIADVFTSQIFNGAQVAVFPEANNLSKLQMSLIASEHNKPVSEREQSVNLQISFRVRQQTLSAR